MGCIRSVEALGRQPFSYSYQCEVGALETINGRMLPIRSISLALRNKSNWQTKTRTTHWSVLEPHSSFVSCARF
jgi:hypothetical protein